MAALMLLLAGCAGSSSTAKRSSGASIAGATAGVSPLVSIGAGLQGHSGLRASLYARGPATTASFALDAEGRLWVAAAGLETHKQDGVYLIAKAGAPALKVVSGLDDPLGMVWHAKELYVASVGRVDEYGDFDGRRFRRHREILSGPVAHGENNLLVLASDGRLVMGVTATCDHCVPSSEYSGSIVSFERDGSGLRLYAGGIRAPVGLAFLPGTSELFASVNQRDDLGAKTPGDWLALVREGEQWRFPECYGQGGAACAGVPKPTAVLDKHAAVGGIAMVSDRLAVGRGTSALVAEWASSKVAQVKLIRSGSSFESSVSTYLKGIRNPLAIIADRGGSLLVGDWTTGRIYQISPAS